MEQHKSLLLASIQGNVDEVTNIIDKLGRDSVDCCLGNGVFCDITALTTAAKHGNIECVRKLIELGDDLYSNGVFNGVYYTKIADDYLGAMVAAASGGHMECVRLIAETRLLPSELNERHCFTEYIRAAKSYDYSCVLELLNKMDNKDITLKGWKGHNLMSLLFLHGCPPSCLQVMIETGIDINGWDYNGLTPLMSSIIGRNLDCVRFLLDRGADVKLPNLFLRSHFKEDGAVHYSDNVTFRYGRTALMYAVCVGNMSTFKLMLESVTKEDINWHEGNNGSFPLLYATKTGNMELVSLLLDYGAEVNDSDFFREGPLSVSISYGYADLFDLFLEKTSNVDIIYVAAEECVALHNTECMAAVIKSCNGEICKGAYEGDLFTVAINNDSLECAQFLIEYGFKVDFINRQGNTVLMISSKYGKDKFVELLIKYGANVNIVSRDEGVTAAVWATLKKEVKCLELLIDAGADLDTVDYDGETIFSVAMLEDGKCMEVLLNRGKMLDDGKLKDVHQNAVKHALKNMVTFPTRNVLLLMQYNIFEWDWCLQIEQLHGVAFAAVVLGVSLGRFIYHNNQYISLLHLAFIKKDSSTMRYLLANLYFLPDDVKFLKEEKANKINDNNSNVEDECSAFESVVEQFTSQPLSLQTLSFLSISKAMSGDVIFSNNRTEKVNGLALPEGLKRKLKFDNAISHLCSRHWNKIDSKHFMGDGKNLGNLIMDKKLIWKTQFIKCIPDCPNCIGLGQTSGSWEDTWEDTFPKL